MKKWHLKSLTILIILASMLFMSSSCLFPGVSLPLPSRPPQTQEAQISPSPTPSPTSAIEPGWKPPSLPAVSEPLPDMASVVTKVRPSVVSIDVKLTTYDIFNQPYTEQGAGSGWIIDPNGFIVTNNHVVENAQEINITLADGRSFPSVTVATDPVNVTWRTSG